jgi:2-dehydro-3-deoxyglucarate aldolase/4-hydroxy-2-oxoheptanedioate aldolase
MVAKSFARRLRDRETLIGTLQSMHSADVSEMLAGAGYDWLFIDAEHGAFTPEQAKPLLQAASPTPCLIRIPSRDDIWIKKALDIGAAGIIVPQINTADEVEQVIRSARYAPQGARGIGIGRAHAYGARFEDYLASANEDTVVVIQAETRLAVDNIEAIVSVPGVDAILIGPYDLSASLGKPGQVNDAGVLEAMQSVRDACLDKKLALGFFGVSPEAVRPWMEQGFTLITVGVDTLFLLSSAQNTLAALKSN